MNKPMNSQIERYFGLDKAFFTGPDFARHHSPIRAMSMFCDDIRLEDSSKLTMIGHYPQELCFMPSSRPVDRVAVYTRATWRSSFRPTTLAIRLDVPGYESRLHPISRAQGEQPSPGEDGYSMVHSVVHLHFIPLRPGDTISAWLRVDDIDLPTGTLTMRPAPLAIARPTPHTD
jgi:hypothetical protein